MKSMSPIKSIRLASTPVKKFDERDDKGVVTSVHGIIHTEFPDFYNTVQGRRKYSSQTNYRNKNVQIVSREIKTIKLEMPVLGLEHAVVYPKNKPSKLPLSKRILKKLIRSEQRIPENLEKIHEINREMKSEKKDAKSVAFFNIGEPKEIAEDVEEINEEEVKRRKSIIINRQKVASDTIIQRKGENVKNKHSSNEILFKTEEEKINDDILNNKLIALKISESRKFISQSIQKKSSFESKIPKPTKLLKYSQKTKKVEEKLEQIQNVDKAKQSETSIKSNNESKHVGINSESISRSKTSQTFETDSVTTQISQTVSKIESTPKSNQSIAGSSNTSARALKVNNVKKTSEKPYLSNKNKKNSSITLAKTKGASKPIKEIKNFLQEIPKIKKTHANSNRNAKKK